MKNHSNSVEDAFQGLGGNEEMLARIIEFFPYPIHVYAPDGTMILTNEACLRIMHIPSKDQIVGKFNVLTDPVIEHWGKGVREQLARSFHGETVQFQDLQMPIQGIIDRFDRDEICFDSSFQNITCFPVYDGNGNLAYVVHVFVTTKLYDGRQEIVKAKEFIELHWREEFDLEQVAAAANLSKHHFSRLFKRYTGMTPLGYYQEYKVSKIKEILHNKNLSVSEAFSSCGVDYSGNYARLFREKTGMTPTQFRKSLQEK